MAEATVLGNPPVVDGEDIQLYLNKNKKRNAKMRQRHILVALVSLLPAPALGQTSHVVELFNGQIVDAKSTDGVAPNANSLGQTATRGSGPAPSTSTGRSSGGLYFRSCDEARRAGYSSMWAGTPGYRTGLDGDGDGVACEPHRGR